MLFIAALCFLGGFAAFFPIVDSLSCYSCLDYPGSSQPCSSPSVEQCDVFYDSCVSSVILAEYFGNRYTTTVKNCSVSQHNCNSSFICDLVNSSIASAGGIMLSCSVNCCYSDLCNGQGGPGNVTLPPWTNPPTTYQPPVTTQQGCGGVSNNILTSPGYPNHYPHNMDCFYSVPIQRGMAMEITFNYFNLESASSCSYDYLRIKNDNNQTIGTYCGYRSGHVVNVTGNVVKILFHSDSSVSRMGYNLSFSDVPLETLRPSTNPPTTYQPPVTTQRPSQVTLSPSAASSTNAPVSTAAPTAGPTAYPTGQGSDPQSLLKYYIATLRGLLDQMEQIVDNDLGCNSSITKREHIDRVLKTIANVDAAVNSAGRQKRDVSQTVTVDELKKKAADLITKLKNKRGHSKRKTQLKDLKSREKTAEKKREAKGRQMMKNVAENIAENVFNMEKIKR